MPENHGGGMTVEETEFEKRKMMRSTECRNHEKHRLTE